MANKINILASKSTGKEITSQLDLGIAKDTDLGEIGMGVLSDGTPYLNQRGLAALCGVQNAHIGTISSQWNDTDEKPRIKAIKSILEKVGYATPRAHIEVLHKGKIHFCYPAEVSLAVLEYYAFDAGANCQPQARDNFRTLAGSKLRDLIYAQVGYDPSGANTHKFEKVIAHPYFLAWRFWACHARVSRIVWKGFAPFSLAVSTVVRTSASACAAHMAR